MMSQKKMNCWNLDSDVSYIISMFYSYNSLEMCKSRANNGMNCGNCSSGIKIWTISSQYLRNC